MPHSFTLPDDCVARMIAKQGRAHTVESLVGPKTALIVIDMQNYFLKPGAQAEAPVGREIVANINAVAAALRAAGGHVVWIETAAPSGEADAWPAYQERYTAAGWANRKKALTPGDEGYELWPALDADAGEAHIVKNRFSALIQGASPLEGWLRERGIDTLLIAGVNTNVCCESTARDAMMLNFRTLMVSDANAAPTDEEHRSALLNLYLYFADVQPTEDVVAMLKRGAGAAAAE